MTRWVRFVFNTGIVDRLKEFLAVLQETPEAFCPGAGFNDYIVVKHDKYSHINKDLSFRWFTGFEVFCGDDIQSTLINLKFHECIYSAEEVSWVQILSVIDNTIHHRLTADFKKLTKTIYNQIAKEGKPPSDWTKISIFVKDYYHLETLITKFNQLGYKIFPDSCNYIKLNSGKYEKAPNLSSKRLLTFYTRDQPFVDSLLEYHLTSLRHCDPLTHDEFMAVAKTITFSSDKKMNNHKRMLLKEIDRVYRHETQ